MEFKFNLNRIFRSFLQSFINYLLIIYRLDGKQDEVDGPTASTTAPGTGEAPVAAQTVQNAGIF